MASPVGVGVIGAGTISDTYLENLTRFADTEVLAIGDLVTEAARAKAAKYDVPAAGEVATVLGHSGVEIVVNLTIPAAHAEVATEAIGAGKHVWKRKAASPGSSQGGQSLLRDAEAAGLLVGCAPDTFLGPGLQTACQLIEQGLIGHTAHRSGAAAAARARVVASQSGIPVRGWCWPAVRRWALLPDSARPGLRVSFLGCCAWVEAKERRVIGSGPKAGEEFDVTVPSHVSALAQFESGQLAQGIFSFDSALPRTLLEVNGTEATMLFPDPNYFDGEIAIRRRDGEAWETVATTTAKSFRGTGVLDMARALRGGRPHRAQGALGYHVLDTMIAIAESVESRTFVEVASSVDKPQLLPDGWDPISRTV